MRGVIPRKMGQTDGRTDGHRIVAEIPSHWRAVSKLTHTLRPISIGVILHQEVCRLSGQN